MDYDGTEEGMSGGGEGVKVVNASATIFICVGQNDDVFVGEIYEAVVNIK